MTDDGIHPSGFGNIPVLNKIMDGLV